MADDKRRVDKSYDAAQGTDVTTSVSAAKSGSDIATDLAAAAAGTTAGKGLGAKAVAGAGPMPKQLPDEDMATFAARLRDWRSKSAATPSPSPSAAAQAKALRGSD